MNNLVLQSFGREGEYRRAILTILSFYAHASAPMADTQVLLFTDNPEYFGPYLSELPVRYIPLTLEKIRMMRGEIDFLHRMKIALIEEAFGLIDGPLLYADSDTFFTADPMPLVAQVSPDKAFMHLPEFPFRENAEDNTATYQAFLQLIGSRTFKLADGSSLKVTPQHWSWNAGVMFLDPHHARFIPNVYTLTNQFYPGSGSHASEQFAFSVILQDNVQLAACETVVYHYWYRVKKKITDHFLAVNLDNALAGKGLARKLTIVKAWTQQFPALYKHHPWMLQDNAIQAFNQHNYGKGYKWVMKALAKKPFGNDTFIADTLYHLKNNLKGRGRERGY